MKITTIVLLSLLISCKQSHQPLQSIKSEKYNNLLKKFNQITFDTLEVSSPSDEVELEQYKYEGVQLDSSDAVLFPKNISEAHFSNPPGLFACYRFKIDSLRQGLIARTPSEYYPSSIKLFIYTLGKDTLIETAELSQYIGDAGAILDVNSWLYKDANKSINAFIWSQESYDNSVEDEKDTTISESSSFSVYNISKDKYIPLGKQVDSLPKNLLRLIRKNINSKSGFPKQKN